MAKTKTPSVAALNKRLKELINYWGEDSAYVQDILNKLNEGKNVTLAKKTKRSKLPSISKAAMEADQKSAEKAVKEAEDKVKQARLEGKDQSTIKILEQEVNYKKLLLRDEKMLLGSTKSWLGEIIETVKGSVKTAEDFASEYDIDYSEKAYEASDKTKSYTDFVKSRLDFAIKKHVDTVSDFKDAFDRYYELVDAGIIDFTDVEITKLLAEADDILHQKTKDDSDAISFASYINQIEERLSITN